MEYLAQNRDVGESGEGPKFKRLPSGVNALVSAGSEKSKGDGKGGKKVERKRRVKGRESQNNRTVDNKSAVAPAATVALAALFALGGAVVLENSESSFGQVEAAKPQENPNVLTLDPNYRVDSQQSEVGEELAFEAAFEQAYGNLLPGEKEEAYAQIREHIKNYSLTNEQIRNIDQAEPYVRASAMGAAIPEDLFMGMVITESRGDPKAYNESSGAEGYLQFMPQMKESLAKKHNITIEELMIPENQLKYGAIELGEYYAKFGDWSLAFWAWHTGEPNVYDAIRVYSNYHLPDIRSDDSEVAMRISAGYRKYITDSRLNTFRLFSDKSEASLRVLAHIGVQIVDGEVIGRDPRWDSTDLYVPLNAAWGVQWDELKQSGLVETQQ